MGLDMYLTAGIYTSDYFRKEEARKIRKMFGVPNSDNLNTVNVEFEVGYWRKANQIHRWFTENCAEGVDECQEVRVSREDLKKLLETCEKVLSSTELVGGKVINGYRFTSEGKKAIIEDGQLLKDHKVAQQLLPPQEGFFFGAQGFDGWYWEQIVYTRDLIKELLTNKVYEKMLFSYHASW